MPRPKGLRKIGGVWYRAEELDATGMPLVNKNVKGYSDTAPVISNAPGAAQLATGPSQNTTSDNRIKAISVHLYSPEQLERISAQTGLTLAGFFGEADSAVQVPVFLNANQSDEDRRAKLTKIRRGI